MHLLTSLICGLLFGAGLTVSQMVNPDKVINFLDVTGNWDPSLAFVMGAALLVFTPGYFFIIKSRDKPVLAPSFFIPTGKLIDRSLIIGAVLFGVGWGLSGICPGPAMTNLLGGETKIIIFVIAMLFGMKLYSLLERYLSTERDRNE